MIWNRFAILDDHWRINDWNGGESAAAYADGRCMLLVFFVLQMQMCRVQTDAIHTTHHTPSNLSERQERGERASKRSSCFLPLTGVFNNHSVLQQRISESRLK